MSAPATTTVQLDEPHHVQVQRREWIVQRIGWLVIVMLLLAAAALHFSVPIR